MRKLVLSSIFCFVCIFTLDLLGWLRQGNLPRRKCQLIQAANKGNWGHKECRGRDAEIWAERRGRGTHLAHKYVYQYGAYMVLSDFLRPNHSHRETSSTTLCVHSHGGQGQTGVELEPDSWNFLARNLPTLVKRWGGPVSVAVYTPHNDFYVALRVISYLRQCSSAVSKWVTFHFVFDLDHWPGLAKGYKSILAINPEQWEEPGLCQSDYKSLFENKSFSFRQRAKLPYPISIVRNVARTRAYTYHTLDAELNLRFHPMHFADMLDKLQLLSNGPQNRKSRRRREVVLLSGWELVGRNDDKLREDDLSGGTGPTVNSGLSLKRRRPCPPHCHNHIIPFAPLDWRAETAIEEDRANVIDGNRKDFKDLLEELKKAPLVMDSDPLFIANQDAPLFDESISIPFQAQDECADKLRLLQVMCLLGYEFRLMTTAFFIQTQASDRTDCAQSTKFLNFSNSASHYQQLLYGSKTNCSLVHF